MDDSRETRHMPSTTTRRSLIYGVDIRTGAAGADYRRSNAFDVTF
jgi:hypothetical protein